MKKPLAYFGWAALIVTPWLLAYAFLPKAKIELSCQSNYEIVRRAGSNQEVRSYGAMTSYYHADGSGVGRYVGTLKLGSRSQPRIMSVYRTTDFTYERIGSFIKINSQKTAKHIGDNADDELVAENVAAIFKSNSVDYFQLMKMENGSLAAGIGTMPRMYCQILNK